jgi:DNA-binding GntR family transcriptional regulator
MNTKLINRPLYEEVAERLREQIFSHELSLKEK